MAIIPKITVTQVDNVKKGIPGMAGRVALVAEFSKTLSAPVFVEKYPDAVSELTTGTITESSPVGDQVLEVLFKGGATEVVGISIDADTAGSPTGAEIVTAATSLDEMYDILLIPYVLTDDALTAVKAYIDDRFEGSQPVGLVAPINRTTVALYKTTAEIFNDGGLLGLVSQQFSVDDTTLSLPQSAAYYAGQIAQKRVDQSFTMKKIEIDGVTPELTFAAPSTTTGSGDDGYELVKAGYPIAKCLNRASQNYVIVNSRLPHTITAVNGDTVNLDVSHERTINYIINLFQLQEYFGEKNNNITLEAIEQRLAQIRYNVVNELGLVNDIVYSVEKVNRDCVRVNIEEIELDGIVTCINANVTYNIE